MVAENPVQLTSHSRVWIIEDGASPANSPRYEGRARATGLSFDAGAISPIRMPKSTRYGEFENVGFLRAQPDLPGVTIENRIDPAVIDRLLTFVRKRCPIDIHLHFGECENPQDFNGGWTTKRIIEDANPSTYTGGDFGAFDEGQEAAITPSLDFSALDMYDVKHLLGSEIAAAELTDEAIDVVICDSITCGACGRTSDGCQIAFILTLDTSGSPGLPPELLYTEDGGSTWGTTTITTLGLANAPDAMACVGTNLVVVSNATGSLHYAPISDILDGVETWQEVSTGFDVAGPPNAITSVAPDATWIAGDAGRVYLAADPTSQVTEQADGSQTSENLNAIHAFDRNNVVAVGNNNAVLYTTNGGSSWALVTGPAVGVALNAVWMKSSSEWLIGTAGGQLWYTRNSGSTWTQKTFPGSGSGQVRDIQFATKNVGYLAHDTTAPLGRVLRTTDGGFSWTVLPDVAGLTITANDRINAIAACVDDPNVALGVGLGDDASDGFGIKFA